VAEEEAAEAGQSGEGEAMLADLDEVVDAAVASVQNEQQSESDRER
jgi:hypothetical protein